jgi:hypothetical protein
MFDYALTETDMLIVTLAITALNVARLLSSHGNPVRITATRY